MAPTLLVPFCKLIFSALKFIVDAVVNCSCDSDEGVLCHDYVSVGPAEDGDCLAHLPRALGTLPLQGAGLLQLGGGIYCIV